MCDQQHSRERESVCVGAKSIQSCLTLGDPKDCSPGTSVHEILQKAKIREWLPFPSSGSSRPRN